MDKRKRGKPLTGALEPDFEKAQSLGDGVSHQVTLNQSLQETDWMRSPISLSTEYHLTIEIPNSQLGRRELSLLLGVLNYQTVVYGMSLNMNLAMWELYFRLLGNKRSSKEIGEPQIRLCLTVSEAILKYFKGSQFSGSGEEFVQLPSHIKDILRPGLMTRRTYGSRFRTYRPERLLRIKIVPVDIQFLTRRKDSQPYSSYCKGYGESHPSTHQVRTKPSAELDGDLRTPEEVENSKEFSRLTDPIHLLSEVLIIRMNNLEE